LIDEFSLSFDVTISLSLSSGSVSLKFVIDWLFGSRLLAAVVLTAVVFAFGDDERPTLALPLDFLE
jgi:hypothetical protein